MEVWRSPRPQHRRPPNLPARPSQPLRLELGRLIEDGALLIHLVLQGPQGA